MRPSFLKMQSLSVSAFFILIMVLSCTSRNKQGNASVESNPSQEVTTDSAKKERSIFTSFSSDAVAGETIYVPVYSHIYQQNEHKTFNLTATLCIRNTDIRHKIRINKVYYYDSKGGVVHKYLDGMQTVPPLSSTSFVVEEEDLRGGVGANFLVVWESTEKVSHPVVEAVMISTSQQQGISFTSEGRVLETLNSDGLNAL